MSSRVKFTHKDEGDHIVIKMKDKRTGVPYYHHGIYCGNNRVVHYDFYQKCIAEVSLEEFVGEYRLEDVEEVLYVSKYPAPEVVGRAKKLADVQFLLDSNTREPLGNQSLSYDLFIRNCEHFTYYCRLGEWNSEQVDFLNQFWFEDFLDRNAENPIVRAIGKFMFDSSINNKAKIAIAATMALFAAGRDVLGGSLGRTLDTKSQHYNEQFIQSRADEIITGVPNPLAHIKEQMRRNQVG
jgi:Lecithin retinol acyltransferase